MNDKEKIITLVDKTYNDIMSSLLEKDLSESEISHLLNIFEKLQNLALLRDAYVLVLADIDKFSDNYGFIEKKSSKIIEKLYNFIEKEKTLLIKIYQISED